MKELIKYYRQIISQYKAFFLFTVLITVLNACIQVALPLYFKYYIDKIEANNAYTNVAIYFLMFVLLILISNGSSIFWHYYTTRFGGKILFDLRYRILNKLALSYYDHVLLKNKETVKNILFSDSLNAFRSMGNFAIQLCAKSFIVILILIIISFINLKILLIVAISFLAGLALSDFSRRRIGKASGKVNRALKNINAFTNSFVDSLKLIQTNTVEDYFYERHRELSDEFVNISLKNDKISVFYKSLLGNINYIFLLLLFTFLIVSGDINSGIGNIILIFFYSGMVFQYSLDVEHLISSIGENLPSFEHLNSLFELTQKSADGIALEEINSVKVSGVSYSFGTNLLPVISNIDFELKKGDIVHLEGTNGSGKSTLVNLMAGLYKPEKGKILINGLPMSDYRLASLKEKILCISQDELLINGSIHNYFKISSKGKSENEINEFLTSWNFFENEPIDASDILIEHLGESLSLGQKRKLLITKLMLNFSSAELVILDELDAHLDHDTQEKFRLLKNQLFPNSNKIIIEITHQNDPLALYNKKLRLVEGSIHHA